MDKPDIRELFNRIQPLTEESWSALSQLFKEKDVRKNDFLIRQGDKAQFCYFLIKGVMRVYYNNMGFEYNKTFFIPGTFPTPLTALLSESVSELSFQALTDATVIQFSYYKFRKLFENHRYLETLFLTILEQIWIKKERHDIRMVTNDATTNYLIFQQEYPGLEQLIPQYHIASYLGITAIQLSRIRARLQKAN